MKYNIIYNFDGKIKKKKQSKKDLLESSEAISGIIDYINENWTGVIKEKKTVIGKGIFLFNA